jgi:hypothetical protein
MLMPVQPGYLTALAVAQVAVLTRDSFFAISAAIAGAMSSKQAWHLLQGRTLHSPSGTHESLPVVELHMHTLFGVSVVSMLQNSLAALLQSASTTQRVALGKTLLSTVYSRVLTVRAAPLEVPSAVQGLKGAASRLPTVRLQSRADTGREFTQVGADTLPCLDV